MITRAVAISALSGLLFETWYSVTIEAPLKLPALPDYVLKFDLVAEHVVWFGQLGLKAVELPSSSLKPVA